MEMAFTKNVFRGRVIIINNLVASVLWHRLACVDPPNGLLSKIQAILVDFFWGTFHWIPQSVLFLPREEGGQDLFTFQAGGQLFDLFSFKGTSQDLRIWSGERWRTLSLIKLEDWV